jgi:hypothetical protein
MIDKLYYWWIHKRRGDSMKQTNEEKIDKQDKEVEIPVGGITADGVVYEKTVRPDGNEPIYKEVSINAPAATEEKKGKEDKAINPPNK